MKSYAITLLSALGLAAGLGGALAATQSVADTVQAHVRAAKAAAGQDLALFDRLCGEPDRPSARRQVLPTARCGTRSPSRSSTISILSARRNIPRGP